MNLQPTTSTIFNDRRLLFAAELDFGGHGQIPITGSGTYIAPSNYVFYKFDFFTATTVSSIVFRNVNTKGETIYNASNAHYTARSFPAGYTWMAPTTSITLGGGTGIAYMYKKFIPEELLCT
jgi:hypothetical protein